MPSLLGQSGIIALWILTSIWLIQREMLELPAATQNYSAVSCSDLESGRLKQWRISMNGECIGGLTSRVEYASGETRKITNGAVALKAFAPGVPNNAVILLRNELCLKHSREFESLQCDFLVRGLERKITLSFLLKNNELKVTGEGIAPLEQGLTIPVRIDSVTESLLWPLDRILNLQPTSQWTTRSAETLGDISASFSWITGSLVESVVKHRVTGSEAVYFAGKWHSCYVVENARGRDCLTKTLVRQSDGVVLQQQLPMANFLLTFDLNKLD